MNILIIEDSNSEFVFLRGALERAMDECLSFAHAGSVGAALAWLKDNHEKVDLIFLDPGLPDAQGYEHAFEQIKPYVQEAPVIISTGDNDEELAKKLLLGGAEDYIIKGSIRRRPDLLKQTVHFAMFRHEAVKDLKKRLDMDELSIHWLSGGYSV